MWGNTCKEKLTIYLYDLHVSWGLIQCPYPSFVGIGGALAMIAQNSLWNLTLSLSPLCLQKHTQTSGHSPPWLYGNLFSGGLNSYVRAGWCLWSQNHSALCCPPCTIPKVSVLWDILLRSHSSHHPHDCPTLAHWWLPLAVLLHSQNHTFNTTSSASSVPCFLLVLSFS